MILLLAALIGIILLASNMTTKMMVLQVWAGREAEKQGR